MRYFATASTDRVRDAMRAGYLGQIITPAAGNRLEPWVEWIYDNGIYSNAYPGDAAYLDLLRAQEDYRSRCRFAVARDKVGDHQATLELSWPLLKPIRQILGRVAICAQNGATPDDFPWDYFDVVFLAGIAECPECGYVPAVENLPLTHCPDCFAKLVEWKLGEMARAITNEAKRRGKWVHMGRVNSAERVGIATDMGCGSGDGTFLAFAPDKLLPELLGWLNPGDFRFMRVEEKPRRPRATAQSGLLDLVAVA